MAKKTIDINTFAPTHPHTGQLEVLDALDNNRFVLLRAGRKWRKTSMMISWLFEKALETGLACPYIAPNKVQAKNIVWTDHINRMLNEFKRKGMDYKKFENELRIELPNKGNVQLYGVENADSLRGISNWGACALDEYDDWVEDIWPLIIRPNLAPHKASALVGGTPKGFRNMYKLEANEAFKSFHFTSHENPELSKEELKNMKKEYKQLGEDYYQQEIMAEYVKPFGVVYEEWPMENYKKVTYEPSLPLHLSMDFGVNDPTSIVWIQPYEGKFRVIDYYEASDGDVGHFVQVIRSKPYKAPDMVVGDPAGKARSITTNTSPIDEYRKHGIYIRTIDGVRIPHQIRLTHKHIKSLYVNESQPGCERFRECILNYKYPEKSAKVRNQSNELPIHDEFSHAMRALEYYFVNYENMKDNKINVKLLPQFFKKNKWSIGSKK